MPPKRKTNEPKEFDKWLKESSVSELEVGLYQMCRKQLKYVQTKKGKCLSGQITMVIKRLHEKTNMPRL